MKRVDLILSERELDAVIKAIEAAQAPGYSVMKHVTGKGNAGKDEVIAAIRARGHAPADDNEADALALLAWAIETQEV